jgi:hypothetical protein
MTEPGEIAIRDAIEGAVSVDPRGWPNPVDPAAYHGLAGEIVHTIDPHTEADPVAILVQFLIAFGNAVGRGPHFTAEADRHGANLFTVLVGETAKARKGVSWGQARCIVEMADAGWAERIVSGLSSGEGLIVQVSNPTRSPAQTKAKGGIGMRPVEISDSGTPDKRLLVFEGEFASPLRMLSRDGNVLSPTIRSAWDTGDLHTLTKNNPTHATGAHISIIGHVTRQELLRYLMATEAGNGFANRFLWICVKRSNILPEGGSLQEKDLIPLVSRVRDALKFARTVGEVQRDKDARNVWQKVYPVLSEGKPGLLGAVTARAEAQVMRLALVYALLDKSDIIQAPHLRAALALWNYAEASVEYIFGDRSGDPIADTILDALRREPAGLTRTQIRDLFGRNYAKTRIDAALARLEQAGEARRTSESTGGRPVERWVLVG